MDLKEETKELLRYLTTQDWCDESDGSSSEGPYWVGKMELTDHGEIQSAMVIGLEELGVTVSNADLQGFWTMVENMDGEFFVQKYDTREAMSNSYTMRAEGVQRVDEVLKNL